MGLGATRGTGSVPPPPFGHFPPSRGSVPASWGAEVPSKRTHNLPSSHRVVHSLRWRRPRGASYREAGAPGKKTSAPARRRRTGEHGARGGAVGTANPIRVPAPRPPSGAATPGEQMEVPPQRLGNGSRHRWLRAPVGLPNTPVGQAAPPGDTSRLLRVFGLDVVGSLSPLCRARGGAYRCSLRVLGDPPERTRQWGGSGGASRDRVHQTPGTSATARLPVSPPPPAVSRPGGAVSGRSRPGARAAAAWAAAQVQIACSQALIVWRSTLLYWQLSSKRSVT